jgi:hypothetical protein
VTLVYPSTSGAQNRGNPFGGSNPTATARSRTRPFVARTVPDGITHAGRVRTATEWFCRKVSYPTCHERTPWTSYQGSRECCSSWRPRQPPLPPRRTETVNHININPSDARDVLDVLGDHNPDGDCECGEFKRHLITAIICAGPEDRARPALGFPSLVAAIGSQTSNPASIEYLEGIARSYERPSGQGR